MGRLYLRADGSPAVESRPSFRALAHPRGGAIAAVSANVAPFGHIVVLDQRHLNGNPCPSIQHRTSTSSKKTGVLTQAGFLIVWERARSNTKSSMITVSDACYGNDAPGSFIKNLGCAHHPVVIFSRAKTRAMSRPAGRLIMRFFKDSQVELGRIKGGVRNTRGSGPVGSAGVLIYITGRVGPERVTLTRSGPTREKWSDP